MVGLADAGASPVSGHVEYETYRLVTGSNNALVVPEGPRMRTGMVPGRVDEDDDMEVER